MRRRIDKVIKVALLSCVISALGYSNVTAAPTEIHGAKPMMVWDYHKSNFDKDGNLRVRPLQTTFSTEGKIVVQPEGIPVINSENTKLGENIQVTFEDNAQSRQWVNNIYRVTVLDALTNNPNLQEDVSFKIENGKLTLFAESRALTYNDLHTIRIYSTGYDTIDHEIHIVKDAPIVTVHPDFRPVVNNDILFVLENFNYAITNPIYEVEVDGEVLEGDCVQYHVVSNIIRIEREGKILTQGEHTVTIRAIGFEDASLTFVVASDSEVANGPFDEEFLQGFTSVKLSKDKSTGGTTTVAVDAVTSASTGGSSGGSGESGGSGSMVVRANLVFDFDMIANAYILKDLGMETEESEKVRLMYEMSSKDSGVLKGVNRKVDWKAFTNKVLEEQVKGKYITFEEYINSPEAEDYVNKSAYMKYVLENGALGEEMLTDEVMMEDAPVVTVVGEPLKGQSIKLTSENSEWIENIRYIQVGSTVLRGSEYKIEGNVITLKEGRFVSGNNNITINSYGFKRKKMNVQVIPSNVSLQLKGEPKVNGIFEVVGLDAEYGKNITEISLNGKSLYSREGVGIDGDYAVYSDKIVFSSSVLKDQNVKVLTVKSYGYSDVVLTFTPLAAEAVDPSKNVVPEMNVVKGTLGETVKIVFTEDNPLWRDKFTGIKNGIFAISKSEYSIDETGIRINGGVFRKGMNTLTVTAEGYDDEVINIHFYAHAPSMTIKNASLENGIVIDAGDWTYIEDIQSVYLDGVELSDTKYTKGITTVTIDKSILTEAKEYAVTIIAENYKNEIVSVNVTETETIVKLKDAPSINTFSDFKVGEDAKIAFTTGLTDYSEWFNTVKVFVDENLVDSNKVSTDSSSITIDSSVFTEEKDYVIKFVSEGYKDISRAFTFVKEEIKEPYEITETYIYNTQSLELMYGDWGRNISEIKVKLDGQEAQLLLIDNHYYADTSNGRLIIKGDVFNRDGWVDITIKSKGYRDLEKRLMIKSKMVPSSEIVVAGDTTITAGTDVRINIPLAYGEASYDVNTVKVDGVILAQDKYSKMSSSITIDGSVFATEGVKTITLIAEKFQDKDLQITVTGNAGEETKLDSPVVSADSVDNVEGEAIVLTFTDNEAWRNSIKSIKVNNSEIYSLYYSKRAGEIEISSSAFSGDGTYTILIESEGYKDVQVSQVIEVKVPEIQTDLENKTVNREEFSFYSKWSEEGSWSYNAATVKHNGVEISPKSSYDFSVTLEEGVNTFEVSIPEHSVTETFTVTYEKPVLVDGPSVSTQNITLGEGVEIMFEEADSAWLEGIESFNVDGEELGSYYYTVYNDSYYGRKIRFTSSAFEEAKNYEIRVKSFPFNDVVINVSVDKKDVPSGVELLTETIKVGEEVKIEVPGGFLSDNYKDSISKVYVDSVETSNFSIVSGDSYGEYILKVDGSEFPLSKTYTIVIESNKYKNKSFDVTVELDTPSTTSSAITID